MFLENAVDGKIRQVSRDGNIEIQEAILNREPLPIGPANPAVPAALNRIPGKALEKDRGLRYQTATDLKTDLMRLKRDSDSGGRRAAELSDSRPSQAKDSSWP